ncbi:MAG TPA: DUF4160 domain-containing protein [Candidatus Binatia bacterium]|jgi:hypothetical protein|nr:DUF4160 domain-containing protein [Candidatus Binatia bacterium]
MMNGSARSEGHPTGREWLAHVPTVLRIGAYRFLFYANDRREPPHVHVERGDATAKFWLSPVRVQGGRGYRRCDMVEANEQRLLRSWNEYFQG